MHAIVCKWKQRAVFRRWFCFCYVDSMDQTQIIKLKSFGSKQLYPVAIWQAQVWHFQPVESCKIQNVSDFREFWDFFNLKNSCPSFILYFSKTAQLYIMILTFQNRVHSSWIIGRMNLLCWWLFSKHVHKIPSFCIHSYIKILETYQCFLSMMLYLNSFPQEIFLMSFIYNFCTWKTMWLFSAYSRGLTVTCVVDILFINDLLNSLGACLDFFLKLFSTFKCHNLSLHSKPPVYSRNFLINNLNMAVPNLCQLLQLPSSYSGNYRL